MDDLRVARGVLRKLPSRRAPRNFTLTPKMAGLKAPTPRAYPAFRFASVFAALIFFISFATRLAAPQPMFASAPMYGYGGGPGMGQGGGMMGPGKGMAPGQGMGPGQPQGGRARLESVDRFDLEPGVPGVGAVSMDLTTIDITDTTGIGEGDTVTLLGSEADVSLNAQQIARWAGTISYVVLCGISARVPRVYV
jgi:hypothetical protein